MTATIQVSSFPNCVTALSRSNVGDDGAEIAATAQCDPSLVAVVIFV